MGIGVDKEAIKTAIREELARKVALSGGPEVFRRLVRGRPDLVEAALQDLVQEGLLTETRLRVGKIYHYPASSAIRLQILAGFMKKMAEAPARPARPAHGAAPAARDPSVPRPARAAGAEPAAPSVGPAVLPAPEIEAAPLAAPSPAEPDTGDQPPKTGGQEAHDSPAAGPASAGPAAEAGPARATPRTDMGKEPWVPKRATPRDPNKPRAVPRSPQAPPAPQPEEPDHA